MLTLTGGVSVDNAPGGSSDMQPGEAVRSAGCIRGRGLFVVSGSQKEGGLFLAVR